ncbi:MAG: hypothetical protein EOQ62_26410 [Mesorhizobium sp.]|uniref:hypothetical protein n=1 Tax=Mesorhizobium sp. TaxID=1871066 RepID=UPI000F764370|nr:hypothetical protein EJ078_09475 [Mesorhizobium sp. M1A.F.Ca.IN.022.06.1.1]RWG42242.1 MAG: hypothetical protein EOQ62_26410 [Mesorhizobium sp.]
MVGDFKNGGRELRRKGDPEQVRAHDFDVPRNPQGARYRDIAANAGLVNSGT